MAFTHTVLFSGNLLAKVCSPLQYDCRRWTGLSSGVICVRISAKLAPALHPNLKPPNRQTNLREIIDSGLQGPQDRRVRRWRHRLPPAPEPQTCSAAAQRKRYLRLPPLSDPMTGPTLVAGTMAQTCIQSSLRTQAKLQSMTTFGPARALTPFEVTYLNF